MERPEHSQVPFLNRRHTRRPRLTRLLDESSAQSIILTGPPGYGKTSLAAEWLGGHPSVAWYRATEGSADLAAFSTGLADVMTPLVPRAGHRLRQRLRVSEPIDSKNVVGGDSVASPTSVAGPSFRASRDDQVR
jgi:ATP/maltotriose-dependent transcriptional regulator MalT